MGEEIKCSVCNHQIFKEDNFICKKCNCNIVKPPMFTNFLEAFNGGYELQSVQRMLSELGEEDTPEAAKKQIKKMHPKLKAVLIQGYFQWQMESNLN